MTFQSGLYCRPCRVNSTIGDDRNIYTLLNKFDYIILYWCTGWVIWRSTMHRNSTCPSCCTLSSKVHRTGDIYGKHRGRWYFVLFAAEQTHLDCAWECTELCAGALWWKCNGVTNTLHHICYLIYFVQQRRAIPAFYRSPLWTATVQVYPITVQNHKLCCSGHGRPRFCSKLYY